MLTPDKLLHISEGAEEIAESLHSDIVKRIVNRISLRIGRGEDYILTAQDKWQIENLQQAGYLLEDIQKDIARATKLQQKEIAEAMEDAGVRTLSYDDRIYKRAGLSPLPLMQSPELIRLMQRSYEATLGEWANFTRTMADESQRLFISELDRAYALVSTGALSYTEAVMEIVNNIVSDGVVVKYPSGRKDTIETATLRAVRTGISQATGQIQTARMDEMGVDLVLVSSHLGARPSHQAWQGKVYSKSGRNAKYLSFRQVTGYGTVEGLCGANCRHSFGPYFEGMDNPFEQYDSEENRKQYEKEQYQRTLERRIRKTKREVMGLKESVDSMEDERAKLNAEIAYQRKCDLLAKQNAAYKDYCEKNGLKPLQDRLNIARWNRQQAAAARGAAKRYENAKVVYYGDGIPKDWKAIDVSKDNAVLNANPNRGKEGYDKNCPNCACAYELRKRGFDVVARPYVSGGSHHLNVNPWEAWVDTKPHDIHTQSELLEYVQKFENGSRFGIAYAHEKLGGHVIVGEYIDGKLIFYDAQKGVRIDNLDFDSIYGVKLWQTNGRKLSDRGRTSCERR